MIIRVSVHSALVALLISLSPLPGLASSRSGELFTRTLGGSLGETGYSLIETPEGDFVGTGVTSSFGAGGSDVMLFRTDEVGSLLWVVTAGGAGADGGYSVCLAEGGGLFVVGETYNFGAGTSDVFLLRYDAAGTLLWARTAGGTARDYGWAVEGTPDGGCIVAGGTASFGVGSESVLLLKYDAAGTLTWAQTFGGAGIDRGLQVWLTGDGGYFVAGYSSTFTSGFLMKLDGTGALTWTRSSGAVLYNAVPTSDGGLVYTGLTGGSAVLCKLDSSGIMEWARSTGVVHSAVGYDVAETTDGGYVVTGYGRNYVTGDWDILMYKYDALGSFLWARQIRRTANPGSYSVGRSILETDDGGIALLGISESTVTSTDALLLKTDADGLIPACPEITTLSPTLGSPSISTAPITLTVGIPPISVAAAYPTVTSPVLPETSLCFVTATPTPSPTETPTLTPTVTLSPTASPTLTPTVTLSPTQSPTHTPTATLSPTASPTLTPTVTLSPTPSPSPTTTVPPPVPATGVPGALLLLALATLALRYRRNRGLSP